MITGAVPVAPYCNFRSALGSPFAGRLPAAIPPPATLFEGRRSGYSSPSTVDAMIQPFSRFVNPFFKKIFSRWISSARALQKIPQGALFGKDFAGFSQATGSSIGSRDLRRGPQAQGYAPEKRFARRSLSKVFFTSRQTGVSPLPDDTSQIFNLSRGSFAFAATAESCVFGHPASFR